jgi:flagellar motor component MotA
MSKRKQVENVGEAISVLVQTAELAQKSGILSFDDAIIVKSSIDFLMAMNGQSQPVETETLEEGPTA